MFACYILIFCTFASTEKYAINFFNFVINFSAMKTSSYLIRLGLLMVCSAPVGLPLATPVFGSAHVVQQVNKCTGVVIDALGEPVIGAAVMVKGGTIGGVTDIDGNFAIDGVKSGDVLQISFVGYKTQEVVWKGGVIKITLEEDSQLLNEVVVVGFGTQKKANLTGAVATLGNDVIASRPVNSVVDAMQGMIPGMNFSIGSGGGALNSTAKFNIRGTGTIGAGSSVSPLVLIDGMEGDLNAVNPQDIDNISVLKDAASASIYGSRAAGGVILVTTKSGKA